MSHTPRSQLNVKFQQAVVPDSYSCCLPMGVCVREMCECMDVCPHHDADGPYAYVDVT